MANLMHWILFTLSCLLLHGVSSQNPEAYIVYMGASGNTMGDEDLEEVKHLEMLSSIISDEEIERVTPIQSYSHAFKGFSAMLTEEEASALSRRDNVVSIFRDPIVNLHTTRSWDFLAGESNPGTGMEFQLPAVSDDVIIGIIDTGIWPESPSFDDVGIGEIPARWKGICMEGPDFGKSSCNRKLIGARYYDTPNGSTPLRSGYSSILAKSVGDSPRDTIGHGTHTASIAAGASINNASYYGLALGTARGGSLTSRIAIYKACSVQGCSGSYILKAIDDAIKDGVDIISISIGVSSIFQSDYLDDPVAIGAFHANQRGVLVICSGGNEGPDPYSVVNTAPWIFTVGASNIDRDYHSKIILGNGQVFQGSGINFSNLTESQYYPLIFGGDVAMNSSVIEEASNCNSNSLDAQKVKGKIVMCINTNLLMTRRSKKEGAQAAGAKGLILIDELEKGTAFNSDDFPLSEVGNADGNQILQYLNGTMNPKATILPTVDVRELKPAPVVAYFSSRGPGSLTEALLKPDVIAPGVGILAAAAPASVTGRVLVGSKPSNFTIKSGTSMACPHVTGAAAVIKSMNPDWSPSMIKSALMTTATAYNNMQQAMTDSSNSTANAHEMGAGEISPFKAQNPGLIFETTTEDYLNFLCNYGYKQQIISSITGTDTTCSEGTAADLMSNLNYPSISIGNLNSTKTGRTITRVATNVGPIYCVYTATVDRPLGLGVKISPEKLIFSDATRKASFRVSFFGENAKKGYNFGSIIWSDGIHSVRIVFAVNIV